MEFLRLFNGSVAEADRAFEQRPFTLMVQGCALASLVVGVSSFVVTLIAHSIPLIAIPAAIITITAAYVFCKTLATAHAIRSNPINRGLRFVGANRLSEGACAVIFKEEMKRDFVIAGLIGIKNFIS